MSKKICLVVGNHFWWNCYSHSPLVVVDGSHSRLYYLGWLSCPVTTQWRSRRIQGLSHRSCSLWTTRFLSTDPQPCRECGFSHWQCGRCLVWAGNSASLDLDVSCFNIKSPCEQNYGSIKKQFSQCGVEELDGNSDEETSSVLNTNADVSEWEQIPAARSKNVVESLKSKEYGGCSVCFGIICDDAL